MVDWMRVDPINALFKLDIIKIQMILFYFFNFKIIFFYINSFQSKLICPTVIKWILNKFYKN
jgi:hypothetical protein